MPSPAIYGPSNVGTPMETFGFSMALAPGMSESTYLRQIAKAITYWQAVIANPSKDTRYGFASTAVGWLQAEQTRVSSPPANQLHVVYPV